MKRVGPLLLALFIVSSIGGCGGETGGGFNGADHSYENLANSNFSNVYLVGADFSHANLTNANFSNANLTGADFSYADLAGADFAGATMQDVVWHFTTCPDGTNSGETGSCLGNGGDPGNPDPEPGYTNTFLCRNVVYDIVRGPDGDTIAISGEVINDWETVKYIDQLTIQVTLDDEIVIGIEDVGVLIPRPNLVFGQMFQPGESAMFNTNPSPAPIPLAATVKVLRIWVNGSAGSVPCVTGL